MSLEELCSIFKQENPTTSLGFSTFARHRPKNCCLPGQSGTHSVCVCTIHQNVKTMLDAINLEQLTVNKDIKMKDYKDCLKQLVREILTDECFFDECQRCSSADTFYENLRNMLEKSTMENIKYAV